MVSNGGRNDYLRPMLEGALLAALALVLSYIKLWQMPQGGSITLKMAPLIFMGLRRGPKWGFAAGALSGLLQLLLGGYVVHPVQAILEYPLASGVLGLSGMFATRPMVGALFAGSLRFACHVAAGAIFFASYAPEGTPALLYSLLYNGTSFIPSIIICAPIAVLLHRKIKLT